MDDVNNKPVLDVSGLPSVAFGPHDTAWLANILYMTIEGMMFALVLAGYFYLRTRSTHWPPSQNPPALVAGAINAVVFLVSLIPAWMAKRAAPAAAKSIIRLGLILLATCGLVAMVVRVYEFASLNCRWTDNAYGSAIWVILGLHSGHLITEWIETVTITAISFTPQMVGMRLADVENNSDYWYFVVATAFIVDFAIYLTPRFL